MDEEYIPTIPEGEEGVEGDHLDEVDDIKQTLLVTEWPEEAEQIPLDVLTLEEQVILLKCRNKAPLNDDELEQLEQILAKYRPAIRKIKPEEVIETVTENQGLVNDINEFLNISEHFTDVQELKFPFTINNQSFTLHLDVHPLLDSTAILDLGKLSMFSDFTTDEFILLSKKNRGEPLTREEEAITRHMNEKLNKLSEDKVKDMLLEFLSMQLTFHGQENTYDEMKTALSRLPLAYITALFYQVQNMTGVTDVKVDEVFQERS